MNREMWLTNRKRWEEFVATPIGKAFARFENLHGTAWQKDTEMGYQGYSDKAAKEAWKRSDEARRELLKLLGYEELTEQPTTNEPGTDPRGTHSPA